MGGRRRRFIATQGGGGDPFLLLLKSVAEQSPLAYYPLAKNALDYSGNRRHATGTNVTYDGEKALFDGTAFINIAVLAPLLTTGEMTVFLRGQSTNVTAINAFVYMQYSFNDGRFDIRANLSTGQPFWYYTMPAPATDYAASSANGDGLLRNTYALTASLTGDKVQAYQNGAAVGAGLTGLQPWGGAPTSTKCVLGANDTASPTTPLIGTMDHVVFFNKALTPANIAALDAFFD